MSVGYHHDESDTSISQDSICFCGWQPIYIIHHHRIAAEIASHLWLTNILELVQLVLVQADNYFYSPIFPWFSHDFPMIFRSIPWHPATSRGCRASGIGKSPPSALTHGVKASVSPFHPAPKSSDGLVMAWPGLVKPDGKCGFHGIYSWFMLAIGWCQLVQFHYGFCWWYPAW